MKCIFVVLAFAAISLHAQTNLNFNKRFVESEDKWVAFEPGKDSAYAYGFIYIDAAAGLTFNYEGTFKILFMKRNERGPTRISAPTLKNKLIIKTKRGPGKKSAPMLLMDYRSTKM